MLASGEFGTNRVNVTVYVLRSVVNGRRYVGITAQLATRLSTHRKRQTRGGQLLDRFELLRTEEFPSYAAARAREIFLKSGQGRAWLDATFGSKTPRRAIDTPSLPPTLPT
ncbi:MAG: GIY-YIG nuclease family protein [Verrucomicrobia bacterium]|nr:GIY-YIG nuclease family protein [Verrucomicrobiota bacterium]